jgi:hypothetical protein
VPLTFMRRQKRYVEQIILVTDEEENSSPLFVDEYRLYQQELSSSPAVVIVRTPGASNRLEKQLREARIGVDVFQFSGDYYALPNLVTLLSRPSKLDLLIEIMAYPLPQRKR